MSDDHNALPAEPSELEHLYRVAPVGLCLTDRDHRYVRINQKLAEINGKSVAEHLGRTIQEVIPDIAPQIESLFQRVIDSGEPIVDHEVRGSTAAKSDEVRIFLGDHYPLRSEDGQVRYVSTIVRDITERKKAEEGLRKAHEELERRIDERTSQLRLLLETTLAIPWEANGDTWQFTYVGPQALKILGYLPDQWIERDFWTTHIHPDDRKFAMDYCLESSKRFKDYEFEYRMIAADGRTVWIHDIVNVESPKNAPTMLRGFMIDITERKEAELALRKNEEALRHREKDLRYLAGRLLSAQEEERRRLARELHDDLTQRLAVLAIEAGKLEKEMETSGHPSTKKLSDIKEQAVSLSADIHSISRRLHPSILDDLGLIYAIQSECRRVSERENMPVDFIHIDVTEALPKSISLCVYRIIQESLRNVTKHANAKKVRVSLSRVKNEVLLSIRDDGRGFNPKGTRGNGGLGLASVEERVRLLQGQVSIQSRKGKGTLIDVHVPLRGDEA